MLCIYLYILKMESIWSFFLNKVINIKLFFIVFFDVIYLSEVIGKSIEEYDFIK